MNPPQDDPVTDTGARRLVELVLSVGYITTVGMVFSFHRANSAPGSEGVDGAGVEHSRLIPICVGICSTAHRQKDQSRFQAIAVDRDLGAVFAFMPVEAVDDEIVQGIFGTVPRECACLRP